MFSSIQRHRDYYAGGLLILIGLGTIYQSSRYELSSLTGSGIFPMAMGVILLLCGIAISLNGTQAHEEEHEVAALSQPEWRGWICIIGGVVAWIFLSQSAGLLPATFACVFISALGDRSTSLKGAAILASAISVFGVLLFYYVLKIQLPPIAW